MILSKHKTIHKSKNVTFIALLVAGLLLLSFLFIFLIPTPNTTAKAIGVSRTISLSEDETMVLISGGVEEATSLYVVEGHAPEDMPEIIFEHHILTIPMQFYPETDLYYISLEGSFSSGALKSNTEYTFVLVGDGIISNYLYYTRVGAVPLPETPTKEGYTFTGWYLDAACTLPYDGSTIESNTTLYAGWKILTFTIELNSLCETTYENLIVDWGTVLELPVPTRVGYTFVGWYETTKQYVDEPVKESKVLVAKWEIKVYTVTFKVNGEIYKTIDVAHGTTLTKALKAANLSYYNVLNESGQKIGSLLTVTDNLDITVAEMTAKEKVGAFIANNIWILWTLGAGFVLFILLVVILIVKKARG